MPSGATAEAVVTFAGANIKKRAAAREAAKIVVSKEGSKRHRAVEDLDLRLLCPEEEPSSIECIDDEVKTDAVDQHFHLNVLAGLAN